MKISWISIVTALAVILIVGSSCVNLQGGSTVKNSANKNLDTATFAGGCFWCMEPPFENTEGVHEVVTGYTGGHVENPSYEAVSSGKTGHYEAIQVTYDPDRVSYEQLLDIFWRQIDPTDDGGQFADRGSQYRTAIFYHDQTQKQLAEQSKMQLENSGRFEKPVAALILPYSTFYRAEEYHQDYYKKNADRYKYYKSGSGREDFLEKNWQQTGNSYENFQKPAERELKKTLNPLQYEVTQENRTEPAFNNEYWDNKEQGIYVDIVSGEPLFASMDKYESGTGWPSFTRPLEPANVVEKIDSSYGMIRLEVRSKYADSHLGHLFYDGPSPTGKRYCINSAALRFIPKGKLLEEGYGEYEPLLTG